MDPSSKPLISVIVLNYNGLAFIERCLRSLVDQTLGNKVEILFADNLSTDGSDALGERLIRAIPHGRFIQHGENLGFCEGNNRAAREANGEYLLFLNNDAWLERDCLEILCRETSRAGAEAASPLVLNFDDETFQSIGALGFDIFGLPSARLEVRTRGEVFMPEGCSYFIRADVFWRIGAFDPAFFMYADEYDLSWRLWAAGCRAVRIPEARVHHRGAANVNPAGGATVVEFRTSDTKRFYANRNSLLVLLKGCQHVLFITLFLQLVLLGCEAIAALVLIRRIGFVRRAYWDALADCWRLRGHVRRERAAISKFRKTSDLGMIRHLTWHLNRWDEVKRMARFGPPKVVAK